MIELEMSSSDLAKLNGLLNALTGKEVHAAINMATRRTSRMARTAAWREIHAIYTMKQRDVYARTHFTKAADGEVILMVRGGFEPLEKYRYYLSASNGVIAAVKRSNKVPVSRSFGLHGKPMRRKGATRFPINGLVEPGVPQLFGNPKVLAAIEKSVQDNLPERLEHEISRILDGAFDMDYHDGFSAANYHRGRRFARATTFSGAGDGY